MKEVTSDGLHLQDVDRRAFAVFKSLEELMPDYPTAAELFRFHASRVPRYTNKAGFRPTAFFTDGVMNNDYIPETCVRRALKRLLKNGYVEHMDNGKWRAK